MTRIVFCCDAGQVRGIGHVMRCLALAEELVGRGAECLFVADLEDVPWAAAQVTSRGFGIHQHADATTGLTEVIIELNPAAVVLDSYHAPTAVSRALRTAGIPILTIIDGASRGQIGDVYVDGNLGAEHLPGPTGSRRLAGLAYTLLRTEVLRLRPDAPPSGARHDPPRVLAYFGGTDAFDAAPVLASVLVASAATFDATFVAARPELRDALLAVPRGAGQRLTVIGPTTELMTHAADADLVISASGTSLWELLCIGAAAAVVWVADNQRLGYERVLAAGAAAGLGHLHEMRADPSGAAATLADLLHDVARRDRLRATGWVLVDGQGRVRVADAVIDLAGLA